MRTLGLRGTERRRDKAEFLVPGGEIFDHNCVGEGSGRQGAPGEYSAARVTLRRGRALPVITLVQYPV